MKKVLLLAAVLGAIFSLAYASSQYKLTWDPNSESDLAGYRTYKRAEGQSYDYSSPMWEGTSTESAQFDTSAWPDGTYYFVVHAYDQAGNESADSNEVSLAVDNPPAPPQGCSITQQ